MKEYRSLRELEWKLASRALNHAVARAAILAVVVLAGGIYAWRWMTPRQATFEGTLLSIDLNSRVGALRIVHPKTGEFMDLQGEIDPHCEIQIDGNVSTLDQLVIGDRIRAEGRMYRWGKVVATRLTRLPRATSRSAAATITSDVALDERAPK